MQVNAGKEVSVIQPTGIWSINYVPVCTDGFFFFFLTFIDKTHITVAKFKTKRKYITILQSHAEWIEIT